MKNLSNQKRLLISCKDIGQHITENYKIGRKDFQLLFIKTFRKLTCNCRKEIEIRAVIHINTPYIVCILYAILK